MLLTHPRVIKQRFLIPDMNNSVWIGEYASSYQWYIKSVQIFSVCVDSPVKVELISVCCRRGPDWCSWPVVRFQSLGGTHKLKGRQVDEQGEPASAMAPASLSWCYGAALALICGSPLVHSALAPENEVPLRPTTWLPEGKITSVTLPKGRTRRYTKR